MASSTYCTFAELGAFLYTGWVNGVSWNLRSCVDPVVVTYGEGWYNPFETEGGNGANVDRWKREGFYYGDLSEPIAFWEIVNSTWMNVWQQLCD